MDHQSARDRSCEDDGEAGYVLAMTALLLVPLMIFAALAVDVGGWYSEASEAQRTADAAALAGVVWMPNETKAVNAALAVAAQNGYVDQPGCDDLPCTPTTFPQVVVSRLSSQEIRVDIFTEGETYFGSVVMSDDIEIQRFATAKYILPVPMGNPTSTLGGGTDLVNGQQANFWLRAMTECEGRGTGDFIGSGGGCPTNTNPNHRDEGHTFIVDVPTDAPYVLQARTTCFEGSDGAQANAGMRFRLFDADDTLIDDNDNVLLPPIAQVTVPRPSTAICPANGSGWTRTSEPAPWVTISPINLAGRYVLQAKNDEYNANRRSLYSLRIVPSGTTGTWSCTRVGPTASATCPNIFARDYLTAYTHGQMFPGGAIGLARLYLAEIDEIHTGKTMQIELFDPADGIDNVRIVDPHGNYAPLTWYTIDCSDFAYQCGQPSYGEFGSPSAPMSQTCPAGVGTVSCVKQASGISFQDRTIRIVIPLTGYSCQKIGGQPDNCWWQVEYEDSDTNANETTTWGVSLTGDPIRLTE